jgi:hypothetical protein
MHVQNKGLFLGHGLLVAIKTVNNDGSDSPVFNALAYSVGKFTG